MESFQLTDIEEVGYSSVEDLQRTVIAAVQFLTYFASMEIDKEQFIRRAQHCVLMLRERAPSNLAFKWTLITRRKSICKELKAQYSSLFYLKKNSIIKNRDVESGGQFRYNLENYIKEFLIQTGTSKIVLTGKPSFSANGRDCYICLYFLKELYQYLCQSYVKIKEPKK